jgi:dienelactone hydrolase
LDRAGSGHHVAVRRGLAVFLVAMIALAGCGSSRSSAPVQPGKQVGLAYANGQQLDLTIPAGPAPHPAIVLVHGGGFSGGDRTELASYADAFGKLGYVVAAIDYRLSSGNWFPAKQLTDPTLVAAANKARDDATAAVNWMRDHASRYGVDEHRIAAVGYSAGGITAIELVAHDAPVDAGVAISGAGIDLTSFSRADAPLLLLHGTADPIIPETLADRTCAAANMSGASCKLQTFPGAAHDLVNQTGMLVPIINSFLQSLPARK